MLAFSRAFDLEQTEDYQMRLLIAHNPYAQKAEDAAKLPKALDAQKTRLEQTPLGGEPPQAGPRSSVTLQDVMRNFGGGPPMIKDADGNVRPMTREEFKRLSRGG